MDNDKAQTSRDRVYAYARLIEKQTGRAVRPYRNDGFVNLLNKYGTQKDPQENYQFNPEPTVPDSLLAQFYEGNGLFARIIDAPAEEAIKHGFELDGVSDEDIINFAMEALDELDWEETAMTAIKWSRLFGGSIAVLLINDGRGLEEPVDWKNIQSIDDIRVYDRSVITPDYTSMFSYDPNDPFRTRGSRLGMPEYYYVTSQYGNFTVHDSRCLVFQNGVLPEQCSNELYRIWGMPEYVRIHKAIRDTEIAHGTAPKMLDRAVQAVYKMKDLSSLLATEDGENKVLKRLQTIDLARGLLNSITIDGEGEEYDFRQFGFSGVSEVIDTTCNYLSALTNIPQSVLFGRSPAGMDATGHSDMENYYNFIERIQKKMLRSNLRYLLSVIFQAGVATGEVDEVPTIKVKFNPLWSLSEADQTALEQQKASVQLTKAQVASTYVQMQVVDPEEVRKKLADSDEFDIETMLDDYSEEDLFPEEEEEQGDAPEAAPEATKLPQDMDTETTNQDARFDEDGNPFGSVGVYVVKDGNVLCGYRKNDSDKGLVGGPGGHIEKDETPEEAAIRETYEEFGIIPTELIPIGIGSEYDDLKPYLFLCTEYKGKIECDDVEMELPHWESIEYIDSGEEEYFEPFLDGVKKLVEAIEKERFFRFDEEPADWITVNGNHIPVDDDGKAIGGQPKALGQDKHKYKSPEIESKIRSVAEMRGTPYYSRDNGESATEARKAFAEEGFTVTSVPGKFSTVIDPETGDYADGVEVFSPDLSYEECNAATKIANGSHSGLDEERYVEICHEHGVAPRLHTEPVEAPEWMTMSKSGKQRRDDTPVYTGVAVSDLLADDELVEYAGASGATSDEQKQRLKDAAQRATESMSDAQAQAVQGYTAQFGYGSYSYVNPYLAGDNPDASQQTIEAAEQITSALDHDIGEKCVTYRGTGSIRTLTQSDELQKVVDEISKNNFSHAGRLVSALEGQEFASPTVISTSSSVDANYSQLPVQVIFKTPANAKAVNVSAMSKYAGGRSSVETALASTGLFGSAQFEREVAYKPGTRYRVDKVVCSADNDRKGKPQGKVFVLCTVLTDNNDSRTDAEPDSWITVNGNHIPVDPEGNAIGGQMKAIGRSVSLIGGKSDPEITDAIEDYYLPEKTRGRLQTIKGIKTYSAFAKYCSDNGIELDTQLESLKGDHADVEHVAVAALCQKIAIGIEAYKDTFGEHCLDKLKRIVLYDDSIDETATYSFNRTGENDPDAGTLRISGWNMTGREVFHELAHVMQDSMSGEEEDAVSFSERINRSCPSSKLAKAYFGASSRDYEAERLADGIAFAFVYGSKSDIDYLNEFIDVYGSDSKDSRKDEEPSSWITVNGNHIPLDEGGDPIGGQQKALGKGSKKLSVTKGKHQGLISSDSYYYTSEYSEALQAFHKAHKKSYELREKRKKLEEELKRESKPKPESEWTDDDEFQSILGNKPIVYTKRGEEIARELSDVKEESYDTLSQRDAASHVLDEIKEDAHREQIKGWRVTEPKKAETTDFVGFTTETTGVPDYDERLEKGSGYIAEMSPEEYMKRCAYEIFDGATIESTVHGTDPETVHKYAEMMASGTTFDMPYLNYSSGNQEGRHRALAALDCGIEKIPVFIVGKPQRNDSRTDEEPASWVTINGNAIPLGENGRAIGGNPKALGVKTPSVSKQMSASTKCKYTSENGETLPFQTWMKENADELTPLYKEGGMDAVKQEYYKGLTEQSTADVSYRSRDEADEALYDHVGQSIYDGWFREGDSGYKPKIVQGVLSSPESRSAALSVMYDSWREATGSDATFEEFLDTPVTMYRGGHGQKHVKDDVFSAYSFDRKIAEGFAGTGGRVYEAKIRPIDTWGSFARNGESEILVPSWIAPNGNVDGKESDDYFSEHEEKSKSNRLTIKYYFDKIKSILNHNADGGKGSGNFGHEGVQGQVGGSAPSGSSKVSRFETKNGTMKINSELSVKTGKKKKSSAIIKANSEITNVESFAGKGADKPLVKAGTIAKQYGGKPKDWSHKTGNTTVTAKDGTQRKAEVHWFENDEIGQCGWKVKHYIEE